jgi:hypothetical protein
MKKTMTSAIAGLLLTSTIGGNAMAQGYPWPPYPGRPQVARFDNGYLDEHPEVARQLGANPALIDNPRYLANHPGLREYLGNHPYVRSELKDHPYRFMSDERRFERWEDGTRPYTLAASAYYLEQHPEVARQLNQRPWLVDDSRYVGDHPGLREFLNTHPIARTEWESHPYRYLHRDDRYERNH